MTKMENTGNINTCKHVEQLNSQTASWSGNWHIYFAKLSAKTAYTHTLITVFTPNSMPCVNCVCMFTKGMCKNVKQHC